MNFYVVRHKNFLLDIYKIDFYKYYFNIVVSKLQSWFTDKSLQTVLDKIQKYVPTEENPKVLYLIEGVLRKTDMAERFEKSFEGMEADGYLIEICNPIDGRL